MSQTTSTSTSTSNSIELRARAQGVIATTAGAWNASRETPRALARRAPLGSVPMRVLRRLEVSRTTVP
ncbi:hypothetical protein GN316_01455 [Xylophilus sp. Kf1]|nr:hypothetical protein [Xylophilus sp. Kf1]